MEEHRYKIIRLPDNEFDLYIDGIAIPLTNEALWHFDSIPKEVLQFSGEQFEYYKALVERLEPLFNAIDALYANYRCSGENEFQAKYFKPEYYGLLLATDLLTQDERDAIFQHQLQIEKEKKRAEKRQTPTFIYLMKDERTDLVKIGRSIQPSFREKTLQSDNPMIVLICAWSGAWGEEKELHKKFEDRRVRGEWFDLTTDDIQEIQNYFGDRPKFIH